MNFHSAHFNPHSLFAGYAPPPIPVIDPLATANALGAAPRRQNVACDQCRNRKVKCLQVPGHEKVCAHQHRTAQLTVACSHLVQQLTTERKRTQQVQRRTRGVSASESQSVCRACGSNSAGAERSGTTTGRRSASLPAASPILQLIAFLLSPENTTQLPDSLASPSYVRSSTSPPRQDSDPNWGDFGRRLIEDESYRIEFTWDLVEAFFQICHARLPFLNPDDFRTSLRAALPTFTSPASQSTTTFTHPSFPPGKISRNQMVHPALLAAVLAWGAKFAEHPVLALDRQSNGGRSVIARTLLRKARHVAEVERIHQLTSADNVIVALLLDALQSQNINDPEALISFYLGAAIRQMFELRINNRAAIMSIPDTALRSTMVFAWWVASITDAHSSAWFRRKPMIDEDDSNVDFYHFNMPVITSSPRPSLEEQQQYTLWYAASSQLAIIARRMSRVLWIPSTEAEGLPFDRLRFIMQSLDEWRDQHLARVGMPNFASSDWGFLEAVNMSSHDALYHTLWIVLFNAIEDFSIKELRDAGLTVSMTSDAPVAAEIPGHSIMLDQILISQIEEARGKLQSEAGMGALRIAELVSVLAQQNYLRLDPNIVHYALYAAGLHLARLGRPETMTCVIGLRQYGLAYEDAYDQADEIERIYAPSSGASSPHMATSVPAQTHSQFAMPHSQPFGFEMFQPANAHFEHHSRSGSDSLMSADGLLPIGDTHVASSADFGGLFGHAPSGTASPSALLGGTPHQTPPRQQPSPGSMSPFSISYSH
ncbi:hypothetical protein BKA62DRAFT_618416 [Auriculariales sp. MPI-PUGE-AT-0066]|nr:hypothetical protein BKA62DRAFT_618416 [Auriculariales sp. MPI-PUGE-AT-0066]